MIRAIAVALLALGFLSSCSKTEEAQPTPSFNKPVLVAPENSSATRLGTPPYAYQTCMAPKIDSVYFNEVTRNKIQLLLRFYWANDTMSFMQVQIRVKGSSANPICSTWTPINGPSFWQVFQDINNLVPGTEYEVRVVAYNSYGMLLPSQWQTVTTLP